jgi:uncharacterized membrane protein (UPF0127 family)
MKIIKCESIFSRLKGLMFSKRLKDSALLFVFPKESRISLHMFFVFFPIDVAFLNEKMKVVDLKQRLKPFTVYTSKKPAKYVLEMPLGSIKTLNKKDFSKL